MARPQKNTVSYFPLDCDDGKKMFYIEEIYGNDGYATFIKLLKELARSEYHYLDLSKPTTLMFLSAKCKVTKEVLLSIIKDLVELGKFDSVLWQENSVIWCQDFVDSIQDAYLKRKNKCITYEGLLQLLIGLGVRKLSKCTENNTNNTQSKVKEIKEDKSKEEETIECSDIFVPKKERDQIDFQEIINIFNSVCSELPKVDKISEKRKKLIIARIKENSLETLGIVFQKISESDFLSGRKTDFIASFDWVMNPANFLKILEDNYKNRKNGGDKSTEQVFADAMQSPLAKIDFFK
jgi:hypothetical protein